MIDLFTTDEKPYISEQEYPFEAYLNTSGFKITVPHGELIYIPHFIEKKIADRTLEVIFSNAQHDWNNTNWHDIEKISDLPWENILWQQDEIKMYGKTIPLPRLSAWYGDNNHNYTFSGIKLEPKPWNKPLLWLKQQIESISPINYNSVLLNWYRSGQDHISWHTDAEPELGKNPTIASLNFGESRRFLLRLKDDHKQKIEVSLGHGDLLIMQGELQHYWQHSIPKQAKIVQGRLNMTFRVIHAN